MPLSRPTAHAPKTWTRSMIKRARPNCVERVGDRVDFHALVSVASKTNSSADAFFAESDCACASPAARPRLWGVGVSVTTVMDQKGSPRHRPVSARARCSRRPNSGLPFIYRTARSSKEGAAPRPHPVRPSPDRTSLFYWRVRAHKRRRRDSVPDASVPACPESEPRHPFFFLASPGP